jgi:hypothetical protein
MTTTTQTATEFLGNATALTHTAIPVPSSIYADEKVCSSLRNGLNRERAFADDAM